MPVDDETCGDNPYTTNHELLAHCRDHTAWLWFGMFSSTVVSPPVEDMQFSI